jgi:UDP-N-acetylmuramate dehydrogenase
MIPEENVLLQGLTTLRVGGLARYLFACASEEDVRAAVAFASERGLPLRVLGEGSNVLAADAGFPGVLLLMRIPGIASSEEGSDVIVSAGAGVHWDDLIRFAAERSLWGIENLAGIPGTVGAAPVQNIGAYGMEAKDTIADVRALDPRTGEAFTLSNEDCAFGYRDSRFKREEGLIILGVSFRLSKDGLPALGYKDLQARSEAGDDLSTPALIGDAVRAIRARKFPDLVAYGTAGSFFKNPTVSAQAYAALAQRYEGLPGFPNGDEVKVPLAFVLDKVLGLRGHHAGNVSLFDAQPLVLVAHDGATSEEIDAFATDIAARVHASTAILIEREVRAFG